MDKSKSSGLLKVVNCESASERRRSQKCRRAGDRRLLWAMEMAKVGIWEWRFNEQDIRYSPQWKQQLGYRDDQLENRFEEFENRIHPDDRQVAVSCIRSLIDQRQSDYDIEIRMLHKDGSYRWFQSCAKAFLVPESILGFHTDITDRKNAEKTLQESESLYRTIFNTSGTAMIILERDGILSLVNNEFERLLGYSKEEILGSRKWMQFVNEEHLERMIEWHRSKLNGMDDKTPAKYELEARDKEGCIKHLFLTASMIPAVEKTVVSLIDLDKRRHLEDALQRSEEKYRSIFENAVEGIFQSSQEKRFLNVNPAFAKMMNYSSPQEMTAQIRDISKQLYVNKKDRMEFNAILKKNGIVQSYETQFYQKGGNSIWVSINARAVFDKQGKPHVYEGTVEEITKRKMAEEQTRRILDNLQKAMLATIEVLSLALGSKDPYTSGHQRRVANLARAIALEMGLAMDVIDGVRMAAIIHDIGKISIPTEILSKPNRLSDLEFNLIKSHSQTGFDILKEVEFPWPIAQIVYQHHERINGTGYPRGLRSSDILIEAKILAVADVVEAMASHRPYRPALGLARALEEISLNRGIVYDPVVVNACTALFQNKGYEFE